ncbi:MAG TPA: sulfurtransferase TusA family protein [Thermodesulfobacteriota bacterium]|nr:sulfurtransferase TusA family protein [Thermodesulfobacteriota bacterium]
MMSDKIDARGLSCPQPVILTSKKIKELEKGVFEVLVDTDTSRENVSRFAQRSGWQVEVDRMEDDYRLVLRKD